MKLDGIINKFAVGGFVLEDQEKCYSYSSYLIRETDPCLKY